MSGAVVLGPAPQGRCFHPWRCLSSDARPGAAARSRFAAGPGISPPVPEPRAVPAPGRVLCLGLVSLKPLGAVRGSDAGRALSDSGAAE